MCMKNINVTTSFFDKSLDSENGDLLLWRRINQVKAVCLDNGQWMIDNLIIVTFVNALSSIEDPNLEKKYEFYWTLGCVKGDEFSNVGIAKDSYDPSKNKVLKIETVTCKTFSNQVFRMNLNNYTVDTPGDYYLKVFLREHGSDQKTWQIQSMNVIHVVF